MSGYADERKTIETLFQTEWAGRTPIGFDGHRFDPVKNSVRLSILSGSARQASIGAPGSNVVRYEGVVSVQVFTDGGGGSAQSRGHEDRISDIFRSRDEGSIRFGLPYVSGSEVDPPFLVRTVMVPFSRDEFHG